MYFSFHIDIKHVDGMGIHRFGGWIQAAGYMLELQLGASGNLWYADARIDEAAASGHSEDAFSLLVFFGGHDVCLGLAGGCC